MEKYMQYNLMQMKKKPVMSSMNSSWEEEAFAEDSMGPLGGFLWPPRSYSCTFCNREFSSAQGLGGHMNVHRRDRAKLQQSPDRKDEVHNPNFPVVKSSFSARFYQENSFHRDHLHESPSSSPRRTTLEENTRRGKQVLKYDDEMISCSNKRPKKTGVPSMEIFQKTSSSEDVDLELRLGDPPAVK